MEKVIRICGKDLPVRTSLKTLIDYKSIFGKDLFEDLDKIQNVDNSLSSLSGVVNVAFQVLYTLHKPYAKEKTFNDFLDTFEFDVFQSTESIEELTSVFSLLFPANKKKETTKTPL